MKQDAAFQFGVRLGFVISGNDSRDATAAMAKQAAMDSDAAAPFNRELCKIACAAFAANGEGHTPEAILFANLSQEKTWNPGYNRFTDCVKRGLAKQASLLPAVAALHDKAGGGVLKTITAGGALGGAALGSLAFLLARNARQSSSDNAQLLEKVRAYKELSRDIREDMGAKNVMETGEETRYNV